MPKRKTEEHRVVYHSMSEFRRKVFPEAHREAERRLLQQKPKSFGEEIAEELLDSASKRLTET